MKLNLKRVTLSGSTEAVTFDNICRKYLVKNFTSGDIYVSFDSNLVEDNSIKIAAGMGQVCLINEHYERSLAVRTNTIYIKGSGEVEVQQLCYL